MSPNSETAAPIAVGSGGGTSKAVVAQKYHLSPQSATVDYAVKAIATRFRLSIPTSREICRLAGIGGAA